MRAVGFINIFTFNLFNQIYINTKPFYLELQQATSMTYISHE